jgi:hypothetical protein
VRNSPSRAGGRAFDARIFWVGCRSRSCFPQRVGHFSASPSVLPQPASCTSTVTPYSCPRVPRLLCWAVNVAKNPARSLRRPRPPRAPSPTQDLHASQLTTRSSRPSLSRKNPHGSQVTSHRWHLGKSFRFRSYVNRPILHYFGANKSFRIRSYRHPARNPFRIRSYKNTQGVASPSRSTRLCALCASVANLSGPVCPGFSAPQWQKDRRIGLAVCTILVHP